MLNGTKGNPDHMLYQRRYYKSSSKKRQPNITL